MSAEIFFYKVGPKEIRVKEILKDSSGRLLERYTLVAVDIFHEALDAGYIRGKCAPGPKECFYLTSKGEAMYHQLDSATKKPKGRQCRTKKEWSEDDPTGCS